MRIGQLADAAGVSAKTVRYYESEGLLHEPDRTPSGYRDYDADTVDRLAFIRHAQAAGLTLRQIREILEVRDGAHAPAGTSPTSSRTVSTRSNGALTSCSTHMSSSASSSSDSTRWIPPTAHHRRSAQPSPAIEPRPAGPDTLDLPVGWKVYGGTRPTDEEVPDGCHSAVLRRVPELADR